MTQKKTAEIKPNAEVFPLWNSLKERVFILPYILGDKTKCEQDEDSLTSKREPWRLSGLKLPLALSFVNQCVSSGGNFLLSVYLARTLSLADFGLYGIGYGLCMLYIGIGNSLILTQMLVNMPSKPLVERDVYAAKMLNAVLLLALLLLTLTTLLFATSYLFWPDSFRFLDTVGAIITAAVCFLFNEFFVSYAYLKRRESLAFIVNIMTMLVLLLGLVLANQSGIALSAELVLAFYALGAASGAAAAYLISPLRLRQGFRHLLPDIIESWLNGRWALGGVAITWAQAQTYAYITILFLGPVGVGQANAAKIFISPFSFLLPAINKIALPRLADLGQTNPARMTKISTLLTLAISLLAAIYSLVLFAGLSPITALILGRNDSNVESLIWIWCLVLLCQMTRAGGSVLLQVQKKFRILTLLNIPSAIVTIILAFILIQTNGTAGAIWSMVVGEFALSYLIWREIFHDKTQHH